MRIKNALLSACLMALASSSFGQGSSKISNNFGSPIMTDSSSTILIPTVYDAKLFSSNKLAFWGNYYSNIIVYDFNADSSKKLFSEDTYIVSLDKIDYSSYRERRTTKNMTSQWILYRVMNVDRNGNGHIDSNDPAILYVSDVRGRQLKPLTSSLENVVSVEIFEKQNIAMIKIQRDQNKDAEFNSKDTDYYYVKLDLDTLSFGKKIELN